MEINRNEDKILKLFFDEPLRKFRFKDIAALSGLHRDNANNWLSSLLKKSLILRHKPKGKYPYYTSNHMNASFRNRKRIYALTMLYECGLLDLLCSIKEASAVILFGSFARSDWHKGSDIDIFLYGLGNQPDFSKFEKILGRKIEIFSCKDRKSLNSLNPHLLRNISRGYYLKGNIPPAGEA